MPTSKPQNAANSARKGVPENTSAELWAREQIRCYGKRLAPTAKLLLLAMAMRARWKGLHLWAGSECLANDAVVSERSVKRARRKLIREGLIRVLAGAEGGAHVGVTVQLCIPLEWILAERERLRSKGVKNCSDFGSTAEQIARENQPKNVAPGSDKTEQPLEITDMSASVTEANASGLLFAQLSPRRVTAGHPSTGDNLSLKQLKERILNNSKHPLAPALASDRSCFEGEVGQSSVPLGQSTEVAAATANPGIGAVSRSEAEAPPSVECQAQTAATTQQTQGSEADNRTGAGKRAAELEDQILSVEHNLGFMWTHAPDATDAIGQLEARLATLQAELEEFRSNCAEQEARDSRFEALKPVNAKIIQRREREIAGFREKLGNAHEEASDVIGHLNVEQQHQGVPPVQGRWIPLVNERSLEGRA